MDDATLTIGELARRAGLRPSAIRHYEAVDVMPAPERVAGRRRYTANAERRLRVIRVAQRAGFSLAEIRLLLAGADEDGAVAKRLRPLAERKLVEVDALLARARAMREWLTVAAGCRCSSLEACGLFDASPGGGEECRFQS